MTGDLVTSVFWLAELKWANELLPPGAALRNLASFAKLGELDRAVKTQDLGCLLSIPLVPERHLKQQPSLLHHSSFY